MDLDKIQNLLEDKQLNELFPEIVLLIKNRISGGEICSVNITKNKYPADHFSDVYSNRLKWVEKKQMIKKYDGFKKTVEILSHFKGFLVVGSLDTIREHIIIFFSEDLEKIVTLFKISK
jgi:hypothetical protein